MFAHAPCAHAEPATESNLTPMAQNAYSRKPGVVCLRRSSVMLSSAAVTYAQSTSVGHAIAQSLPSQHRHRGAHRRPLRNGNNRRAIQESRRTAAPVAVTLTNNASAMVAHAPRAHGKPAMESNLTPMARKACSRVMCVFCLRRSSACEAIKCYGHTCTLDQC